MNGMGGNSILCMHVLSFIVETEEKMGHLIYLERMIREIGAV